MLLRTLSSLACTAVLATACLAQNDQPLPSPVAENTVTLNGHEIKVHYNSPSMHGRKIMGELVPYDKVWRTGANEATTFTTSSNLKIGTVTVPAGSYTLYTLPGASQWMLIINKQTS